MFVWRSLLLSTKPYTHVIRDESKGTMSFSHFFIHIWSHCLVILCQYTATVYSDMLSDRTEACRHLTLVVCQLNFLPVCICLIFKWWHMSHTVCFLELKVVYFAWTECYKIRRLWIQSLQANCFVFYWLILGQLLLRLGARVVLSLIVGLVVRPQAVHVMKTDHWHWPPYCIGKYNLLWTKAHARWI